MKPSYFVIPFFMLFFLWGCNDKEKSSIYSETDEDINIHANMKYFNFDEVANLSLFFDSIAINHGIPIRDLGGEEHNENLVKNCINMIDKFRKNDIKYYPNSLVRASIDLLGFESAFIANHGCVDLSYAEWFLMLVAYYSPDITWLVDMQTPNHCVGVLNFGSTYNSSPWWSYLFLKRQQGYEVRMINKDETKIEKLFQIVDMGQTYYLCSNNQPRGEFLQILYWEKNKENVVMVAQCDSISVSNQEDFELCYYNPEQRRWYCCNREKHTDKLIPTNESPALILKLNKENSCFSYRE